MLDDALMKADGEAQLVLRVGARDHLQGPVDAKVTLLEYGDFQCKRSVRAFPLVSEIKRWLRGELCFAFRHFPIVEKHPNALEAAEAAEAAGAQGKFWEMHNLLFERSSAVGGFYLSRYAQELGLDLGRFEYELREHIFLAKVREDFRSGVASRVIETPTFFINGARYVRPTALDSLLAAIEDAGNQRATTGNSH